MVKIYKTPQAEQDYEKIILYSYENFGLETAQNTMRQLEALENKLKNNLDHGKLDPQFHSSRFKYDFINNRSKVFFERFEDAVIIVMAGGDSRNWKKIFKEMELYIELQIELTKRRIESEDCGS